MKRLLRSIIDFGGVSQDNLVQNFQKLRQAQIDWSNPADDRIFEYATDYFQQRMEMPSGTTVFDHFNDVGDNGDVEVLERIKDIQVCPEYIRTNYVQLLKNIQEQQNTAKTIALLKETSEIVTRGLEIREEGKKVKKLGVRDALVHFTSRAHDLVPSDYNSKTSGDLREEGQVVWDTYLDAKLNKDKSWGKFTGINEIDKVCRGIRKGELWIHAAAPGELKTTFALNWCYNLITRYKTNVLFFSLEMPYEQIMLNIYVMHSANAKWRQEGHKPLDHKKVRDGELTEEEELFYKRVIDDFTNNPEYCHFEVRSPDKDVTIKDIRLEAELTHKQMDVGLLVIDHGGLVEASLGKKSKDYTIEINSVIREAKKACLHFNHGEKMATLMLFQINRQGKDEASKNDGRYKFSSLAYANECLVGNTLIKGKSGLIRMDKVSVGDEVWSTSGWKPVLNIFRQGKRDTVRVDTDHGINIQTTKNHRLRVLDDGAVKWVRADALIPNQHYVLSDYATRPFPTECPALPPISFEKYEKPCGMRGLPIAVPSHITEDLAYLMGAYEGDGVKGTLSRIGFTGNRLELAVKKRIVDSFYNTFGHPLEVYESPSRPGSFDMGKHSKALKRWFVSVGMDRLPGVPASILCAPKNIVLSYLRGFWDTDGSINSQGILALSQKSANRKTLEEVQLLMSDLGIETTLSEGMQTLRGKIFGRCMLVVRTHDGHQRFTESIGFTEPHKMARLVEGIKSPQNGRNLWPVGSLYLDIFNRFSKGYGNGLGNGHIRFEAVCRSAANAIHNGVRNLVPTTAIKSLLYHLEGVEDKHVETLRMLFTQTRPHLVTKITPMGREPVYDLEVTGDHEYSTNGLLSHNCEKSADYITTTYLDQKHRDAGTTLFCNLKNRGNEIIPPFLAQVNFASRRIGNRVADSGMNGNGMAVEDYQSVLDAMSSVGG